MESRRNKDRTVREDGKPDRARTGRMAAEQMKKEKAAPGKAQEGREKPVQGKADRPKTEKAAPGKARTGRENPGQGKAEMSKKEQLKPEKLSKKKSRCPVSALCGGCTMIDVPYEDQIQGKQKVLEELIGEFVTPDPFIRMKAPEHYRHKVTSVFAPDYRGRPVCGIYREGTHEVIPVKSCLIEHIQADRIIQTIFRLLADFRIRVYDEDMDRGLLRYVQIRAARATKEIMVTLVLTDPVLPSRNTFVKKLVKLHPEITTIVINVNDRNTTMILGNRETVIYGRGYIEDVLCGKRFRISSRSFYQVNPLMTEKLYNIAIDCAALSGKETVLDTYCGIGTIGIIAAPLARRVIGVELNAEAVRDAQQNIRMNGLTNVEILQGDATRFMMELAAAHGDHIAAGQENSGSAVSGKIFTGKPGKGVLTESEEGIPVKSWEGLLMETEESIPAQSWESLFPVPGEDTPDILSPDALPGNVDVIFMDPPRSGSTEDFMRAACTLRPKKIVYISCSPWSLQRDLAFFTQNGYSVRKAIPVDMFPFTGGIETVVLLTHNV
ncbi:MAG: 23S rRNA (uracil(1939)-C(5))-methyltransferase RlmD [Eubacteriales bacterium]|nr:23S rRNA (uracil(1939)-C(5))-methyltransferase RlmD [Eubacteriales bacterium]